MSSFHDVNFPLPLAFGASGGPKRQTEIVTLASGYEQRNTSQAHSRRHYDAGVGIKSLKDMQTLVSFFEGRFGQLYGFRFRDPQDYKSCPAPDQISAVDQQIGIGDGITTSFQLVKNYGDSLNTWIRPITKPVIGQVVIAIDGTLTVSFSLDAANGMINFMTPPGNGAVITAGFEFDVPVRFDTDQLNTSLESFGAGGAVNVPLIEVKTDA